MTGKGEECDQGIDKPNIVGFIPDVEMEVCLGFRNGGLFLAKRYCHPGFLNTGVHIKYTIFVIVID